MKAYCTNCKTESNVRKEVMGNRSCLSCGFIINERESTKYYLKEMIRIDEFYNLYD